MRFLIVFLLMLVLATSCKKEVQSEFVPANKDTLVVQNKKNINSIGYVLTPEAVAFYKDWSQYTQFDTFISRYFAISNAEALINAKTLSKMATEMKDSAKTHLPDDPSLVARLNILDNECKRLADMSTISAIKPDEVSQQIRNILDAHTALNAKLNATLQIREMESELQLDPDFVSVLNQVPKFDTIHDVKSVNTPKNIPHQLNNAQQKLLKKIDWEHLKKSKKTKSLPVQPN